MTQVSGLILMKFTRVGNFGAIFFLHLVAWLHRLLIPEQGPIRKSGSLGQMLFEDNIYKQFYTITYEFANIKKKALSVYKNGILDKDT